MKNVYRLANHSRDTRREQIPTRPTNAEQRARIVAAMRDNRRYKTGDTTMTNTPTIPLAVLAIKLGQPVEQLAARLDGSLVLDGVGLRCVSRETAAEVIAEHRAQQEARQAEQARRRAEHRARMAELSARDPARLRGGVPAQSGNAYADMLAADRR